MFWQTKITFGKCTISVSVLLEFHASNQKKPDTSNHGRTNNKNMDVGQLSSHKIKVSLIRHYLNFLQSLSDRVDSADGSMMQILSRPIYLYDSSNTFPYL